MERRWNERCWITASAVIICWLICASWMLIDGLETLSISFSDTDNAMRLVEMRQFLTGHSSWYDMTIARTDPPGGLVSHWSRLIDAGQAAMVMTFSLMMSGAKAEMWMRAVWPLLWLLPTLAAMAMMGRKLAGGTGALASMGVVLFVPTILFDRFMPGEIDHHNVQISLAAIAIAATLWAKDHKTAAIIAGISVGLMPNIGLENALFVILTGAIFGLRFIVQGESVARLKFFGPALALTSFIGLIASLPPNRWGEMVCDANALNISAPLILVGLAMWAFSLLAPVKGGWVLRLIMMATSGLVAISVFIGLDPACLKGPFAHVDPRIGPIWLDNVHEAQPWLMLLRQSPLQAIVVSIYGWLVLAALVVGFFIGWIKGEKWWLMSAAVLCSIIMMFEMVRSQSYVVVFAAPVAAAMAITLIKKYNMNSAIGQLAVMAVTVPVFSYVAAFIGLSLTGLENSSKDEYAKPVCLNAKNISPLTAAADGLIIADINLGPSILARTGHSVVAAPYHRLSHGILLGHAVLHGPLSKARNLALSNRVDYIAYCNSSANNDAEEAVDSLTRSLQNGTVPDWLQPIELPDQQALRLYRVN